MGWYAGEVMSVEGEKCEFCHRPLRSEAVWLEMDCRSATFTDARIARGNSQGYFPFHIGCGNRELVRSARVRKERKDEA